MSIDYWTIERIEQLRALYAEGDSSSQIAAKMGRISRNAVIGKVHRLGLLRRGKNGNYKGNGRTAGAPKTVVTFRPKPRPEQNLEIQPEDIIPFDLTIMDLGPFHCRYPYGDVPFLTFCGHPQIPGSSYCSGHFMLSRRSSEKREVKIYAVPA